MKRKINKLYFLKFVLGGQVTAELGGGGHVRGSRAPHQSQAKTVLVCHGDPEMWSISQVGHPLITD